MVATVVAAVASNLDVLALASLAGPQAAGVYSSGRTLALPVAIVGTAVGAVLLPKLARVSSPETRRQYARQIGWRVAVASSLLAGVLLAAAPTLVLVVYGSAYTEATATFRILVVAHSFDLIAWPSIDLLLVLDRPAVIAALNSVFLGATLVGLVVLVPLVGASGAAWAIVAGRLLILVPYLFVLWAPSPTTTTAARTPAPLAG
jgi:O-antigen/teichoic acid export membrane protein